MSEEPSAGERFSRRRRANAPGARRHAHQVKVTPEEEAQLLLRAAQQGVTVPRFLVESALAAAPGETTTERREVIALLFRQYRLLAAVSNNVNQIAKATNATGEVHVELVSTLAAVRGLAERIDSAVDELSRT
ncbi:MAG: MobC family plasmid mobilization relaxosome protein [Propionibacterium sp.]|nr:MobC family plasmid mobilization relaxosome protein [Propionibacterium sp.]